MVATTISSLKNPPTNLTGTLFGPLLTKRFDKLYGKSLYYKHLKI